MNPQSGKFESVSWAGFCSDTISWITRLYCMAGYISTVLSPPHCIGNIYFVIYSEITEDVTQPVVESLECTAMCCLQSRDEPYHQMNDFTSSKKKQGSQIQTFQKSWLKTHPWLSYCTTRNVVFCFYCRNA